MRDEMMNVIDEALYRLAEFYLAEDRTDEALAVIGRVAEESPDKMARSASHFNLARIYEDRKGDSESARREYARVTGRLAGAARAKIIGPLRRKKKWDECIAFLKECIAAAEEPLDKAEAVRALISTAHASGETERIESVFLSIPDLITYEEATEAKEAVQARRKEQMERVRQQAAERSSAKAPAPGGGMSRLRPGRPVSRAGLRRDEAAPTARAGREPPPPVGRGTGVEMPPRRGGDAERRKLEAEIRELERAGFLEEARRLRRQLQEQKLKEDRF